MMQPETIDKIYRKYLSLVKRTIRVYLTSVGQYKRHHENIDDIAHEAFIKFIRAYDKFIAGDNQNIPGFLTVLSRNTCIDYIKANANKLTTRFSELEEAKDSGTSFDIDTLVYTNSRNRKQHSPLEYTERSNTYSIIHDIVDNKLTNKFYREIIIHLYFKELSASEYNKYSNKKLGTISGNLNRALTQVRKEYLKIQKSVIEP